MSNDKNKDKSDNKSDEISIDLSSVKNLFGKSIGKSKIKKGADKKDHKEKKEKLTATKTDSSDSTKSHLSEHKAAANPHHESESNDERFSIDFSSVKNVLSSKSSKKDLKESETKEQKTEHKSEKIHKSVSDDEDISFDFSKFKKFFSKYGFLFLLLIPIALTLVIRLQTNSLPATDAWAQSSVENYFKNQIRTQIDQQYPNLAEDSKQRLIDENYVKVYAQNKAQIDAQATYLSSQYKDYFKDEHGYTYMADIDSYFWLRQAQNILDHGFIGDKVVDGVKIDDHMLAPIGTPSGNSNIHPYAIAYLFPIFKIFSPNITLMQTSFYVPIIVAILCSICAFFVGRKIAGNVGGFFASMILSINQLFISRTFGSDNDIWNVFFPLLLFWVFLEALDSESTLKRVILASLAGVVSGFYAFAWSGWWFMFFILIGALGIYLIYIFVTNKNLLKHPSLIFKDQKIIAWLLLAIPFIIFTALFVTLVNDFSTFTSAAMAPFAFISIKNAVHPTLWPNVYTTVAELNPGNFSQIIATVGGNLFFIVAILGVLLTILIKDKDGNFDVKTASIILLWFLGTLYSSYKGVRFIFLILPAFSIAFGVAFGLSYRYLLKWFIKDFSLDEKISKAVILVAMILLIISPVKAAYDTGKSLIPTMNDPWYNTLKDIKDKSDKDAIINSWWDFGHWFKYLADRKVTFDGASQNVPQAHWIGKVLLTDDQDLAMSILRMLDCGANNAAEKIDKKFNNTRKSVELLYTVLENQGKEKEILKNAGFSDSEADEILQYTICSNVPEDYFIASEDMIGKSGVWAHFGSWDFRRAETWVSLRSMPKEQAVNYMIKEYNYTLSQAESLYDEASAIYDEGFANNWVAQWPNYVSGKGPCRQINSTLFCENQIGNQYVVVNFSMKTKEAIIPATTGAMYPASVVYVENGAAHEKKFNQSNVAYSIILIPEETGYSNVWSSPQLANSMFTKLFYLNGTGLDHFELFSHYSGITGTNVYTYKINWKGKSFAQKNKQTLDSANAYGTSAKLKVLSNDSELNLTADTNTISTVTLTTSSNESSGNAANVIQNKTNATDSSII